MLRTTDSNYHSNYLPNELLFRVLLFLVISLTPPPANNYLTVGFLSSSLRGHHLRRPTVKIIFNPRKSLINEVGMSFLNTLTFYNTVSGHARRRCLSLRRPLWVVKKSNYTSYNIIVLSVSLCPYSLPQVYVWLITLPCMKLKLQWSEKYTF